MYHLATGIIELGQADEVERLETAIYESFEESGTDLEDFPAPIRIALEEFIPDLVDNYLNMAFFELAYYLLLILPVVLMFRQKKLGLWLYTTIQIIGSLEFVFFFRLNMITIFLTAGFVLWAALFILLYLQNRKALH